jgi:hypothetical protein
MSRSISARVGFFLFARSHAQLEYYLRVDDARRAANDRLLTTAQGGHPQANIVGIRSRRGQP